MSIVNKALNNEYIDSSAKEFIEVKDIVEDTTKLLMKFNNQYLDKTERQNLFSQIIRQPVATSNEINAPFHTDFGPHIFLGKNIFINKDCLFIDLGGIYLGDDVLIGPRTTIISVNHAEKSDQRSGLILKSVHIEDGAWLGAGVMVMPGVTIGKNAIIGAGSIVTKDIPANKVAVGNPAHVIRDVQQ